MAIYTRENLLLSDILLDIENPRFASYFERTDKTEPSQDDVADYLLQHESIGGLATRIQAVGGLHPAEAIVCCKQEGKYIVLEGNRRVCACKALHRIFSENGKSWLPEDVIPEFPFLDTSEQENIELIQNTNVLNAVVYDSREFAQPYISDKHIDGVKKWESIEKSSYFYRMYQEMKKEKPTMSANNIVSDIAKISVSNKTEVKNCIVKYNFFMSTYKALRETYSPDALTGTNSYLPLVDRFMNTLVGNSECGLNLTLSTNFEYVPHLGQETLYKRILKLVGEAFLVRKTEANCESGELPRINSKEIDTNVQQRNLIKEDKRIPGLFVLIKQYRELTKTDDKNNTTSTGGKSGTNATPPNGTSNPNTGNGPISPAVYEPDIPWKPSRPQNKSLSFSTDEGASFNLSDDNDEDAKIKFVIRELSRLYVYAYPYACTLLYRTLLEASTRRAYREKKPRENGIRLQYNDNDLAGQILKLADNSLIGLSASDRGTVKSKIKQENLIKVLNDYIHNPKIVDTDFILTSWVTMKEYVKACLS